MKCPKCGEETCILWDRLCPTCWEKEEGELSHEKQVGMDN